MTVARDASSAFAATAMRAMRYHSIPT